MTDLTSDKLAIREVVENWVVWRDAGDWERFATVWHPDGWMTATWFQGPAAAGLSRSAGRDSSGASTSSTRLEDGAAISRSRGQFPKPR